MHPALVTQVITGIEQIGGTVSRDPETHLLTINGEFTAAIVLSRCRMAPSGARRWLVRLDEGLTPDITIAARLSPGETSVMDHYLLPWIDLDLSSLRLRDANGLSLDAFRFDSLDPFFALVPEHRSGRLDDGRP